MVQQRRIVVVQVPPSACTAAEPSSVGMVPAAWGLFWPLLASTHQGEMWLEEEVALGRPWWVLGLFQEKPQVLAKGGAEHTLGRAGGAALGGSPAHLDSLGGSQGGLSFLCACLG